jgi:pimeloyl-ACP methyl ester carboxylesterase
MEVEVDSGRSGEEPAMGTTEGRDDRLDWRRVEVDGRAAVYGVAGGGPPVLFLHGWALNHRSYRHALQRLAGSGVRVYAPAMPGFGGTAELPRDQFSLVGYAAWVARFLDAIEVTEKLTVVGHSFGGGVAIQLAHDATRRVGRLVLVNSIGGSVWRTDRRGRDRHMRDRPVWDWGLHLPADAFSLRELTRIAPVIAADAVPNAFLHPRSLWRIGGLARSADLTTELNDLRRRRLPVVILWGRNDTVLPAACLESMRAALGDPEVRTVDGSHGWLLTSPGRFAEELTNIIADGRTGTTPGAGAA